MPFISTRKTLNLHKYNIKLTEILSNWKIIIPIIFTFSGIIAGCYSGKGESSLFLRITDYFTTVIMSADKFTPTKSIGFFIVFPSVLILLIFFLGLSVFGSLISNTVPLCYGFFVGSVSFFMYKEYILKGLAYCIIMLYPYCVLTLLAIILCCRECVNMSGFITASISKKAKFPNYSFVVYYKAFFRNYVFIIVAAVIKTMFDYLFGSIFTF